MQTFCDILVEIETIAIINKKIPAILISDPFKGNPANIPPNPMALTNPIPQYGHAGESITNKNPPEPETEEFIFFNVFIWYTRRDINIPANKEDSNNVTIDKYDIAENVPMNTCNAIFHPGRLMNNALLNSNILSEIKTNVIKTAKNR